MTDTTIDEDDILQFDEDDGPIIGYNFPPNIRHIDFYNYRHSLVGVEFPQLKSICIARYNISLNGVNFQNIKKLTLDRCLDVPELTLRSMCAIDKLTIEFIRTSHVDISNVDELIFLNCDINEIYAKNINKLTINNCFTSYVQTDANYLKYINTKSIFREYRLSAFNIKCNTIEVNDFNDFDSMSLANGTIIKAGQEINDSRFQQIGPNTYQYNNFGMVFID
jgi:hypothetical protein